MGVLEVRETTQESLRQQYTEHTQNRLQKVFNRGFAVLWGGFSFVPGGLTS